MQMFNKLLENSKVQQKESLWAMKPEQQTTKLLTTQLGVAMGLPFNVNAQRR